MLPLLTLMAALGFAPLAFGVIALGGPRWQHHRDWKAVASSAVLCALSFNLTFIWQELWLVIPKALTPGLHPVLFHNDHTWTGTAATTELLQGTGAIATLISGLAFLAVLAVNAKGPPAWRLFMFWMAFQGLNQSLVQLALGSLLPGNDVGRALTYLHVEGDSRTACLVLAAFMLAFSGRALAQVFPARTEKGRRGRGNPTMLLVPGIASILLAVPFRLPRDIVEVLLIPTVVSSIGLGWLLTGAVFARSATFATEEPTNLMIPIGALLATLLFFMFILRPGVVF